MAIQSVPQNINPSTHRENPYDARTWPHDVTNNRYVAVVMEALHGANVVARLLQNNELLAEFARSSDSPESEEQPFAGNTVSGLQAALNVCLDRATEAVERMNVAPGGATDRVISDG